MSRELWAGLLLAAYALLCAACWLAHRRRQQRAAADAAALLPAADAGPATLVLHASQTGTAEELAWQSARALHLAGLPVRVAALGDITADELHAARQALFVVSTYGEGDAPDSAAGFVNALMSRQDLDLGRLSVAVLALGDQTYAQFCGFGRALDAWLLERGARPLFPRIDVDRHDTAALAEWRRHLSHIAGSTEALDWQEQPFEAWRLVERRHLNPGSAGAPVCHLGFEPVDGRALPDWQAGDLVQLQLAGADTTPREYTLASLPRDGRLELMVRQLQREDGSLGQASGWLTQGLAIGDTAALRLRAHNGFRIGDNALRPLILIGNGTGLAGLRAHLKARESAGSPPVWLLYGERQAAHDAHYADEISAWRDQGLLAHADLVYSRDGGPLRYVQQQLAQQRERLRDWVAQGAAIYVCGSLEGMAAGVHEVLCDTLGSAQLDALTTQGRYRRDVY
ncbi:MAG: oxidoreductase [Roseateles depolymerans]|uniref:NADPH--hemoprotein reductase n=1 Tax=Roseateles depolymerans TaxID=76731 RepID=A0A2W5DNB6_9BURK|nr:MAG: oxidoreductase [Roseateles depolymerans]